MASIPRKTSPAWSGSSVERAVTAEPEMDSEEGAGGAGANANVARHLGTRAEDAPDRLAVRVPRASGRSLSFADVSYRRLEAITARLGGRLASAGIRKGSRVSVLARPGLELIAGVFAILRIGAIPVVIDPGMGLRAFLRCVRRSRPDAVFGIRRGLWVSRVFRGAFRFVRARIPADAVHGDPAGAAMSFPLVPTSPEDRAAILFTSGSTGPAKGVVYEHGMFEAQIEAVRDGFGIEPGEVDFPMLPVFALFNPALGMTTVVPPMDPARPAKADPGLQLRVLREAGATNTFGSPVLWRRIVEAAEADGGRLPDLRRILVAGAALPPALAARMGEVFPGARVYSPYGATEALPLTVIGREGILAAAPETERGAGVCVGRPLPGVRLRVVAPGAEPGPSGGPADLGPGEVGEILASGPMVTREYDAMEDATRQAKVSDGDRFWHRMGDLGYRDGEGRLWFCGRVAERVVTGAGAVLYPECCEQVFNRHPRVYRTALVGIGPANDRVPGIVVQPADGKVPRGEEEIGRWVAELRELGATTAMTTGIRHFFFRRDFPVDVRHNAKIHRLRLAKEYAAHGWHPTE